ncbi:MAG: LacI family transcriptional regulator [Acidobacteriaceae bacterium]|nr:LacI family transcriptional regulator [Acidobacteriaceae bacterium]
MAIRLKDIARDLDVSTVTVSKVLRGNADIGPETRQRVLARLKELNYQPNMLARGLASGKTYAVGLVVPDLVHPFFAQFARSLSGVLRESNRALILSSSEEDPELERQEIRTLLRRGIDVLLIASCQAQSTRSFYDPAKEKTPFLLFDRNLPHLGANFVGSDDVMVGEMATCHLIDLGRKRIAHIGTRHTSTALNRLVGYQNALARHYLHRDERLVVLKERVEEIGDREGFVAMQELLRLKGSNAMPDAVFCYNDQTALGAIDAVLHAGLRVPEDVALIGCGNLRYADYLRIPLSSIDHGTAELGRIAGERALELAANPDQKPRSILVPPKLMARASTIGKQGNCMKIATHPAQNHVKRAQTRKTTCLIETKGNKSLGKVAV